MWRGVKDSENSVTSNYGFEDTGWCKIEGEWDFFFSPLAVPSPGLSVRSVCKDNDPYSICVPPPIFFFFFLRACGSDVIRSGVGQWSSGNRQTSSVPGGTLLYCASHYDACWCDAPSSCAETRCYETSGFSTPPLTHILSTTGTQRWSKTSPAPRLISLQNQLCAEVTMGWLSGEWGRGGGGKPELSGAPKVKMSETRRVEWISCHPFTLIGIRG